jgi:hypothetical protein
LQKKYLLFIERENDEFIKIFYMYLFILVIYQFHSFRRYVPNVTFYSQIYDTDVTYVLAHELNKQGFNMFAGIYNKKNKTSLKMNPHHEQ